MPHVTGKLSGIGGAHAEGIMRHKSSFININQTSTVQQTYVVYNSRQLMLLN